MNRDFYFFGIFFLAIYVLAALYHDIIFFQIGYQMYNLHSFTTWLFVLIITVFIGAVFMLICFYHKSYKFSFVAGSLAVGAGLFQNLLYFFILQFVLKDLQQYYIYSVILSLGTSFLFGISLVFSKAGKNLWLRSMGIYILILGCFTFYLLHLSLNNNPESTGLITKLNQWITFAAHLQFIPLIIYFYGKLKSSKSDPVLTGPYKFSDSLSALGGITILIIMIFGYKIGIQSYWSKHISPSTKAIAKPFEARSHINNDGDTLLYRLLIPENYNEDTPYPLVLCLHGGAGYGTDNYRQFEGSLFAKMLSRPENREKYPAFILVPQCPPGSSWGGIADLPTVDALVLETIRSVENEFSIDENRLYVTGHSLGGYGAWYFIGKNPDKFAAAIPVSGEGDTNLAPYMLNVAIWAFHGANDRNVPVSGSRAIIEAIRNGGGDPRYTESPDGGHGWKIVEDNPDVLDWLFSQKRSERY